MPKKTTRNLRRYESRRCQITDREVFPTVMHDEEGDLSRTMREWYLTDFMEI